VKWGGIGLAVGGLILCNQKRIYGFDMSSSKRKCFQSLSLCLLLVSLNGLATSAHAAERDEYRYVCDMEYSDHQALLTVDAFGKYLIYEDSGNNCNGRGSRLAHSHYTVFETDCEWKEGFVNFVLRSEMLAGEARAEMIAQVGKVIQPAQRYDCERIQ
jgi:hypothetical protein